MHLGALPKLPTGFTADDFTFAQNVKGTGERSLNFLSGTYRLIKKFPAIQEWRVAEVASEIHTQSEYTVLILDEWHLPACKLDSDIWILEDSLDSVVLETFQGVDQGCEPADIFAIWILHSGVYRMHNPEKRCLHSLFCILYPMQMPVDRNCPAARLGSFPGFWIWILDFAG